MGIDESKKYIEKALHKCTGKIHSLESDEYGCMLVLRKGAGKKARFLAFKADRYNTELINRLPQFRANTAVKVRFMIKSAEWKGRWYTTLLLRDVQLYAGRKAEKEQAMARMRSDNQYSRSLFEQHDQ